MKKIYIIIIALLLIPNITKAEKSREPQWDEIEKSEAKLKALESLIKEGEKEFTNNNLSKADLSLYEFSEVKCFFNKEYQVNYEKGYASDPYIDTPFLVYNEGNNKKDQYLDKNGIIFNLSTLKKNTFFKHGDSTRGVTLFKDGDAINIVEFTSIGSWFISIYPYKFNDSDKFIAVMSRHNSMFSKDGPSFGQSYGYCVRNN